MYMIVNGVIAVNGLQPALEIILISQKGRFERYTEKQRFKPPQPLKKRPVNNTQLMPIRTQIKYIRALEDLVTEGKYPSRNAAANAAIIAFLESIDAVKQTN
jgi:hypothetical protein